MVIFLHLQKGIKGINFSISVTAVRFANNDKSLVACCSLDGKLSICQLTPSPASVLYLLSGHKAGITGN